MRYCTTSPNFEINGTKMGEILPKKFYAFKKSEVFSDQYYKDNPEKVPDWLAEEFNILWVKYSELIPEGSEALIPYEEYPLKLEPIYVKEDKQEDKVDSVILWRHKNKGEHVPDLDLTGRSFLNMFLKEDML